MIFLPGGLLRDPNKPQQPQQQSHFRLKMNMAHAILAKKMPAFKVT